MHIRADVTVIMLILMTIATLFVAGFVTPLVLPAIPLFIAGAVVIPNKYKPNDLLKIPTPNFKKHKQLTADQEKIVELESALGINTDYEVQDIVESGGKFPKLPNGYRWEFTHNEDRWSHGDRIYNEDYMVKVFNCYTEIVSHYVEPRKHKDAESLRAAIDRNIAKCYRTVLEHHSKSSQHDSIMHEYEV